MEIPMNFLKTLFVTSLLSASFLSVPGAIAQDAADDPAAQVDSWATQCNATARSGEISCFMEQKIALRDSGQLVVSVTIQIPPETRVPTVVIQVPLGVFLPAGVIVQVDEGIAQPYEIKTCDQGGCYVGEPLGDDFVLAMENGQNLNIKFQNFSQEEIVIPVPLTGFRDSYYSIR